MNINMHKFCYKQISKEEIEVFFSNFYCVYIYIVFQSRINIPSLRLRLEISSKKNVYENSNTVNIDGAVSRVNMF